MTDYLTGEQVGQLLRSINPARVMHSNGQSHVEAYDVRAHLNRLFGFARWSADVLDVALLYEAPGQGKNGKPAYSVGYRARLRLTVNAPDGTTLATYTEVATGAATNFPEAKRADAHDFAVKKAESQALKRAAVNLGDQFGLSLYRNGYTGPVVVGTIVMPDAAAAEGGVDDAAPSVVQERDETPPEDPTEPATRSGGAALRNAVAPKAATDAQRRAVVQAATAAGHTTPEQALTAVSAIVGREVTSTSELTADEAEAVVIDLAAAA